MKNNLLITFFLCFCLINGLKAQYGDSKAISLYGGFEENGFYITGTYDMFISQKEFISMGFQTNFEKWKRDRQEIEYEMNYKFKANMYLLSVDYNREILSDVYGMFVLYVGAGLRAGYNDVNGGNRTFETGTTIKEKEGFVFGGAVKAQFSAFLFNIGRSNMSFIVDAQQQYFTNKKQGKGFYTIGGGLRFMLH